MFASIVSDIADHDANPLDSQRVQFKILGQLEIPILSIDCSSVSGDSLDSRCPSSVEKG